MSSSNIDQLDFDRMSTSPWNISVVCAHVPTAALHMDNPDRGITRGD